MRWGAERSGIGPARVEKRAARAPSSESGLIAFELGFAGLDTARPSAAGPGAGAVQKRGPIDRGSESIRGSGSLVDEATV